MAAPEALDQVTNDVGVITDGDADLANWSSTLSSSSLYGYVTHDVIVETSESGFSLCADVIPTTHQLFSYMPVAGQVCIALLVLVCIATVAVYIEELIFVFRHFKPGARREKTAWILAFFPVFSVCGLIGVIVPRSGTLVDMIANVYFSTCLYSFGYLMMHYMGGPDKMWQIIGNDRKVSLNTPPCCCCCVCLPTITYNRNIYFRLTLSVMQVAVVRPVIMFLAAVMWTNDSYQPGNMSLDNGYLYISCINLVSTMVAYYGLTVARVALLPELEDRFSVTGKILSLQLTLLSSAIPNLVIGIFVSTDVIHCGGLFPSKARGEAIYHGLLIIIMLPFSLLGRKFYRRQSDGIELADGNNEINA